MLIQQLKQKMAVDQELEDMAYIVELKKNIDLMSKRYHVRIQEKNFDMADQIDKIIILYKKELDNVIRDNANNTCEVSEAQPTGNKRVFILQR